MELPDGRIQRVEYHVSGESGFVATVTYETNPNAAQIDKEPETRKPSVPLEVEISEDDTQINRHYNLYQE